MLQGRGTPSLKPRDRANAACAAGGTDARRARRPGQAVAADASRRGSSSASAGRGTAPQPTRRPARRLRARAADNRRSAARRAWSHGRRPARQHRRDSAAKRWTGSRTRSRALRRSEPARSPPRDAARSTRLSKNRKKRGSVSAGHGRIDSTATDTASPALHAAAARHHMQTLLISSTRVIFGKVGMRQFHPDKALPPL